MRIIKMHSPNSDHVDGFVRDQLEKVSVDPKLSAKMVKQMKFPVGVEGAVVAGAKAGSWLKWFGLSSSVVIISVATYFFVANKNENKAAEQKVKENLVQPSTVNNNNLTKNNAENIDQKNNTIKNFTENDKNSLENNNQTVINNNQTKPFNNRPSVNTGIEQKTKDNIYPQQHQQGSNTNEAKEADLTTNQQLVKTQTEKVKADSVTKVSKQKTNTKPKDSAVNIIWQ
jgi:hypothetical protein